MKTSRLLTAFATAALLLGCAPGGQKAEGPYYIDIKDRAQLHEWFRYSPERPVVISGHRGGMVTGFPENCIESFEKTLTMMPSFFEIDPRMTKDSVIVLMHDATIDRTTTGTGKVSDYTYAELQQFFLKDREGNVTTYKIPTLEECIAWSQGKTILNLDIKDVPLEVMSQFINRLAPANVMYTVRNAKQARTYLDRDPQAMFSCWCKNMKEFNEYVGGADSLVAGDGLRRHDDAARPAGALRQPAPQRSDVHDLARPDARPQGHRRAENTGLRARNPDGLRRHRNRLPLLIPEPRSQPQVNKWLHSKNTARSTRTTS